MTDSLQKYLAELLGTFTLVFIGTTAILAARERSAPRTSPSASPSASRCSPGSTPSRMCRAGTSTRACRSRCSSTSGSTAAHDRLLDLPAGRSRAGLALRAHRVQPERGGADGDAARRVGSGNGAVPRAAGDGDLRARHPPLDGRSNGTLGTALVAIPLTLVAAHLALIPFSGSSLNTARSFGPALIGSEWTDFWVYIVGPLGGAIIGWVCTRSSSWGESRLKAPPPPPQPPAQAAD